MADALVPEQPAIITCPLKGLPDALDAAVYLHERWPLVLDADGQATRYLQYQNGQVLHASSREDMAPERIRKVLVNALGRGYWVIFNLGPLALELETFFSPGFFPAEALTRASLFKEEVWSTLLRPDAGDPSPQQFLPRDEFKLIVVSTAPEPQPRTAALMTVVRCGGLAKPEAGGPARSELDVYAAAMGLKEIKRNSTKMCEAAFDGDWAGVEEELGRGYHIDSVDAHEHTPLSEAACTGADEVVQKLLERGSDPNFCNDAGRTPLWRAAYNGHLTTCRLLLEAGADPEMRAGDQVAYDVGKSQEVRDLLAGWNPADTARLMGERRAKMESELEKRITTQTEREAHARELLRTELVALAAAAGGEAAARALRTRLQEIASEALKYGEKPRGTASVRDERGQTLLAIAVWKGRLETAQMLLTHAASLDSGDEADEVERKTFWVNVNAKDSRGWNATQVAAFHGHKDLLALLLNAGGDWRCKNSFNKSCEDLVKDERDAAGLVVTDRSEIRRVLQSWVEENAEKLRLEKLAAAGVLVGAQAAAAVAEAAAAGAAAAAPAAVPGPVAAKGGGKGGKAGGSGGKDAKGAASAATGKGKAKGKGAAAAPAASAAAGSAADGAAATAASAPAPAPPAKAAKGAPAGSPVAAVRAKKQGSV